MQNLFNCWKLLLSEGQSAAKPRASEEGSTTIENITAKKYCRKEVSRVEISNFEIRGFLKRIKQLRNMI